MLYDDTEFVQTVQRIIEFLGTFAFAISGIRHAAAKNFDWFGGFVCGVAVAIGGGTIRDVMLGVVPFWMTNPFYLICTALAQVFVIALARSLKRLDNAWFVFDTLGLALFNDNKELRDKLSAYPISKKEMFTFTSSEGVELDGWMIKPADFNPQKKYPVILFQYSGPGSQQVVDSWNIGSMGQGGLFDYYLAQEGFIVVCVDGRGTGARGAEWEKCTYQMLGNLEAKDQVETALWLGKQSYVDKDNIGIWGWSYGGYCTLMSMSEGRGVFKAGVAVAPPTDYRFYDSIYTERFMRTPKENPTGYNDNPVTRAEKFHGALLLCHGLADDNVHPQNTFEYTEALVQADKDFTMNVYTNRNHSIYGGNTRNHLLRQISQFFINHLK